MMQVMSDSAHKKPAAGRTPPRPVQLRGFHMASMRTRPFALVLSCLAVLSLCAGAAPALSEADLKTPQQSFQELFAAVQDAQIFADGKSFVDAVPKSAPDLILAEFRAHRPESKEALAQFVAAHFAMPASADAAPSPPDQVPLLQHIDRLWDVLTRRTPTAPTYSSLLPLPQAYVVPGGRFREIYYWDSYFTMLGLGSAGRNDLIEGMVSDFAYLIDTFGHVPNGARTYYLSRSQPERMASSIPYSSAFKSTGMIAGVSIVARDCPSANQREPKSQPLSAAARMSR